MMKSLVNNIDDSVMESLYGLSFSYPRLEYQVSHRVVLIPKLETRKKKVSLICGGGSGHEPFAAGYVGNGMLTAAVAGSIYAAPPSLHVSYAIDRVSAHDKTGIFMIVPNYTGDCLNFGVAIERAKQQDLNIADIIVDEDCSISKENLSLAGKRGFCGIVFIIKITGALAENGMPLDEITKTAQRVLRNMATYSIGLTACSIPGQPPMFELAEDEIELGMGIHGEAGHKKRKIASSSELVGLMLERISGELSLKSGDAVAVIVNNLGALSQLEQGIVVHDVIKHLRSMNVQPLRVYAGLLMTSLNSAGVQITVLNLSERDRNLFLSCLDAPTDAPKWPGCVYSVPDESWARTIRQDSVLRIVERRGSEIGSELQTLLRRCLKSACEALIREEDRLNDLDRGCGDGDTGSTLKRLATEILKKFDELQFSHPSSILSELANIAEERMGGASGGLYSLYLTSMNAELCVPKVKDGWPNLWARAMRTSLEMVMKYGKAKPGDRSMVDALHAVSETFEKTLSQNKSWIEICDAVKAATWRACESTKNMKARVGRASYVREDQCFRKIDAGAYAIATIVDAIMNELSLITAHRTE